MRRKSTPKQLNEPTLENTELEESVILGVTADGDCVYIHSFDDDFRAIEFIEILLAGFRAEVLSEMFKRQIN